jgi:hypothetical protein
MEYSRRFWLAALGLRAVVALASRAPHIDDRGIVLDVRRIKLLIICTLVRQFLAI